MAVAIIAISLVISRVTARRPMLKALVVVPVLLEEALADLTVVAMEDTPELPRAISAVVPTTLRETVRLKP